MNDEGPLSDNPEIFPFHGLRGCHMSTVGGLQLDRVSAKSFVSAHLGWICLFRIMIILPPIALGTISDAKAKMACRKSPQGGVAARTSW